ERRARPPPGPARRTSASAAHRRLALAGRRSRGRRGVRGTHVPRPLGARGAPVRGRGHHRPHASPRRFRRRSRLGTCRGVLRRVPGTRRRARAEPHVGCAGSAPGAGGRHGRHGAARRLAGGARPWPRARAGARLGRLVGRTGCLRRDRQLDHLDRLLRPARCPRGSQLPTCRGAVDDRVAGRFPREGGGIPMITESIHEAYRDLDAWPAAKILAAVNDANRRAIDAVAAALPDLERAAVGIEDRLGAGGRLFYAGAGTSGRVAVQDAAELPPTFGFDRARVLLAGGQAAQDRAEEGAEDDVVAAAAAVDEAGVGPRDALVGIAASGVTPYTVAAVRRAKERGAFTVGIANNPDTPLLTVGEVGILLATGPEVLAGSTRLAAGTAQKAALNALSTAVLVRLGGAYGNLMVGMRPVNAKLEKRAAAIVAEAAEVSRDPDAEVLARPEHDRRTASVMARTGVDAGRAREAVRQHGGRVRDALRDIEQR